MEQARPFRLAFLLSFPVLVFGTLCVCSMGRAEEAAKAPAAKTPAAKTPAAKTPTAKAPTAKAISDKAVAGRCSVFTTENLRQVVGVNQQCRLCHADRGDASPIPGFPNARKNRWVRLNEIMTFAEKDKHFQSYAVLLKGKSKHMARVLKDADGWEGVVDEDGQSQIHRDKRCLACHAGIPVHQLDPHSGTLIDKDTTNDFRLNSGVSCEGCHGPAGNGKNGTRGWLMAHTKSDEWRFMAREQKRDQYGYFDVRSTISKTRMCLSCHLGNVEQGKVVTHEMFAAGHPPLPGFEVTSFVVQQPQHWEELKCKPKKLRDEYLEKTGETYHSDHLNKSKAMLVAALASQGEAFTLVADLADQDTACPKAITKPAWPELSQFACFSCHHDLDEVSWRQSRGYKISPGRPVLHEWPAATALVAMKFLSISEERMTQALKPTADALDETPFGKPDNLARGTRQTAEWFNTLASDLEKRAINKDDGQTLLDAICHVATTETLDYDSARQIVWAFAVVYRELKEDPNECPESDDQLLGWYVDKKGKALSGLDPIETKLADLNGIFRLDLRHGKEATSIPVGGTDRTVVELDPQRVLPLVVKYRPQEFQDRFAKIRELLSESRDAAK